MNPPGSSALFCFNVIDFVPKIVVASPTHYSRIVQAGIPWADYDGDTYMGNPAGSVCPAPFDDAYVLRAPFNAIFR